MTPRPVVIRGTMQGVEGMLLINGVPVEPWVEATEEKSICVSDVSAWLRGGTNSFSALLQRGRSAVPCRVELAVEDSDGATLAKLDVDGRGRTNGFRHASFELPSGAATRLWKDAAPLQKTSELDAEAQQIYQQAVAAIGVRDVEALLRLRVYAMRDAARLDANLLEGRDWPVVARAVLGEVFESARLVPVRADTLRCELVGDGRVLSVWSPPRAAPFTFVDETDRVTFSMCLHLARIDGVLRWVR